jgi:hypothetical protein
VDGPEFDGHEVDFDLLMSRQQQYVRQEKESLETYLSNAADSNAVAAKATASDATACNRAVAAGV